MKLAVGQRVMVGAVAVNAYLTWRGQQPITDSVPGTIVAKGPRGAGWLVRLDTALPTGTEGAARVVRNTVTARGLDLVAI